MLLAQCLLPLPHDHDEAGDDEVFCGTCNVAASLSPCAKVAAGFIKACVPLCVCVCVCGCGCVSVRVCVSLCVRVIVEAFAVAAFLDTTFWFFSAADPSGRLWAVCAVGVAGRQRFVAYFNFVVCSRKRKLFHCILWSSPSRRSLYLPPSLSHFPLVSTHCLPPSSLSFVSVANL